MNPHKLRVTRSVVGGTAKGAAVAHRENIAHGRLMALPHDMPHSPFTPISVGPGLRPMPGTYDAAPTAGGVMPNAPPRAIAAVANTNVTLPARPLIGLGGPLATTRHMPLSATIAAQAKRP